MATHQIDLQMLPPPPVSDLTVKNQTQAEQAITNCWHPTMKLLIHRRAKTWAIKMYLVFSSHLISVVKDRIPSLCSGVPIEKTNTKEISQMAIQIMLIINPIVGKKKIGQFDFVKSTVVENTAIPSFKRL